MMKIVYPLAGLFALAAVGLGSGAAQTAAEIPLNALAKATHFHGLAVDPTDSTRLFLATHHGLFSVDRKGLARKLSASSDDFMGFTAHPTNPGVLYASGHPVNGGNLGFMTSRDGGISWTALSPGADGPVDFHQMDVSKADPNVVYGIYGNIQRSTDGGRTWGIIGPAPAGLISIAASSRSVDTLYAATQDGLLRSEDGGRSWSPAHSLNRPASMVHVARDGTVYAFLLGFGLIKTTEPNLSWQPVGLASNDLYVLHFAVDPKDQSKLYAVTMEAAKHALAVMTSSDGGASWSELGTQ